MFLAGFIFGVLVGAFTMWWGGVLLQFMRQWPERRDAARGAAGAEEGK